MAFPPLLPLHRQPRDPTRLEQYALLAVPNPGETAQHFPQPWHSVRIDLEKREHAEMREKYRKEHAKKFRHVMKELKCVDDLNWMWRLFPRHVLMLLQSNVSVVV